MTDVTDRSPRTAAVLRASTLLLLFALLLWHQGSVGATADAALGGAGEATSEPAWPGRAAVPLALCGALLLVGGPLRALLLAAAGALAVLLLTTDVAYLQVFERPFSVDLLVLLGQGWSVRGSAVRLLSVHHAVALAGVLGLAVADLLLARRRGARSAWRGRVAGVVLMAVAAPSLGDAWHLLGREGARLREVFVDLETVRSHGAFLYHVADLGRALRRDAARDRLDPRREEALLGAVARRWTRNRAPSPLEGVAAGRSVILLQLESVESFVVGRTVAGGALTPTLDRLRRGALEFDRCHDLASAGRTSDAEFMVLTSLRPDPVRPVAYAGTATRYEGLPRVLAGAGYRTLSLHAYQPWFWNRAVAHPLYGIQDLWFDETFHEGERLFLGLADVPFLTQAADRLARVPRPFLALCITLSCHHPFGAVPAHLESFDVGFEDDEMAAGYLRLVRYTDEAVGAFLRRLKALGLTDECLIVAYGDHVSGLPPESRRRLAARLGVELEPLSAQRVPLLFLVPGEEEAMAAERARVRDVPCSLQDVAPTVLHLLGREIPAGWLGVHLLAPAASRPVVPLRGGLGVSAPELVADDPAVVVGTRAWRDAQEELRFGEAMRMHDGQARAAGLGEDELRRLADEPPVPFSAAGDAPPWELRFDAPSRPLDGGARVLPFLPFPPVPVELDLELENRGGGERPFRLEAFTVDGAAAATRDGRLAAGERRTLALSRDDALAGSGAFWARLLADEAVGAALVLRSPFGDSRRDLAGRTAARTVLTGSAAGVELALVLVVNPTGRPIDVNVLVEPPGDPPLALDRTVASRSAISTRVPLDGRTGEVRVVVEGDGAVARVVRFSHGGRRVR